MPMNPRLQTEKPPSADRPVARTMVGPCRPPKEINGPRGPEPTRYGDWERAGRCIDF
ncbi:MAG: DUF1674 domain-containing protein [Gammaproteobacteria bacterium]